MPLQSTAGPATPSSLLLPPPLSRVNARRSPSLDQRRRYRASTAGPPQSLHASSRVPAARHRIVCPCRRRGGSPSLTRRSSPEKPGPFSQTRSPETEKMNKRVERRKRVSRMLPAPIPLHVREFWHHGMNYLFGPRDLMPVVNVVVCIGCDPFTDWLLGSF
ncbi:Os07g0420000 [Oryza sativa Japonica Group]|uniref:Os07g0420000 protein n=1 Tax=Oryza sativa subsp. japonica TaxID=39947 RepID=Q0D6Y0_ORYSJ|nr:Os07g0420000 [Oryza sativa Japonica Group]|eukprot:NP_001059479.2 Os07g0420000 [Oryza sativa Japonica Group]